jgi:predicted dehydrogenase
MEFYTSKGGAIMLRFGILGCGGISTRFCTALEKESGVKIQAVAARDPAKAAAFGEQFGAERACSYEELVRDSDVDIVYIGTVHSHHAEQIKLCLEHGKSVLCEKPMVLHEKDARECFALAKEKNLLLMENMWVRSNPCFRQAQEWVKSGRIGEPRLVTAKFCFHSSYNPESRLYSEETAGGAIYDVGVYGIEFATGILGESPEFVTAAYQTVGTGVDGCASISLRFGSGAIASVLCAINVAAGDDAYIYGSKGSISMKHFWKAHDAVLFDEKGNEIDRFSADFEDGFSFQIQHVVELMERGATVSDLIPPGDTIVCANVFDKIIEKTH